MAVIENRFICDLAKPVQAQALKGNVFSLDNLGSRISVLIYDNGQPATISGSVTANCILPDGSTVNVNGSMTTENGGSKAYVDVPQSCLLIPGILKIAIKCTSSSVITTLAAIVANVYMTKTDNVITPSAQIISDWNAEISAQLASAVKFSSQSLTDTQKATARSNISAASSSELQAEATARATADTTLQGNIDAEAATRAAADADLKSAIDAIDGDNNAVTVSPFETPYTDSGITVSNNNGKVEIYGTASAARTLLCFNGQEQNAWSAYAFNQTLPAGTYVVHFSTENWPDGDQALITYTYTTFANVNYVSDGKMIIADNPIMLGILIRKNTNFGTSESPALMDVSIYEYKEKADKKTTDQIGTDMFASGNLTINSSNVNQYPSMDQMPTNRLVTVLSNAASSITDYPYSTSGYVFTSGTVGTYNSIQVVVPSLNQTGTMAIRQKNNNAWGQWKKIPPFGCGDTGTDQYASIYTALTNSKTIILPPGDYVINSTIFMPDGASIKGCGRSTRLIAGESLTGAVIRMRTNNNISDLAILGSETAFSPDGETDDTCGILVSGSGQSDTTQRRNAISNVEICNFAGSGITLKDTGDGIEGGVLCENSFIHNCNIGINIPNVSEFNRFTNLNINSNYIGIYNNGGNNIFCNCSISGNKNTGLKMYSTKDPTTGEESAYNNSHGVFSGCEFAHTGIDNAHPGYAVDIEGMTKTEHFIGCIFGYGYTRIKNSYGIQFTSCTYTSRTNIYIDQSGNEGAKGAVIFMGCNSQGVTEPPLSVTPENASGVHFVNCYNRNGLLVTRYP